MSVPATSANMGPGFDSFGFAVDLENELLVERGPFAMEIVGEGAESLPVREERGQLDGMGLVRLRGSYVTQERVSPVLLCLVCSSPFASCHVDVVTRAHLACCLCRRVVRVHSFIATTE